MLNKINISPERQKLIVYIVLAFITLVVYWQVNQYDFINLDDNMYVTSNIHIQSVRTLEGILWSFSTKYFGLWNPLVWLSFIFDYQIHGLNAGGYHLTNLILHIMTTLLLFWLFNRMTGAIWKSAFVAGLFALHPLHVESVAWIAERKDVLSGFFWMLTLCLYVYYTEKPLMRRYLLVLLSFACALMSKPMVVTLPVVMILLDYWPLDRLQSRKIVTNMPEIISVSANKEKKKKKIKKEALMKNISTPRVQKLSEPKIAGIIPLWQLWEKIPLFFLSAVLAAITLFHQQPPVKRFLFPLDSRLANALVSFVSYLEKTFWPHNMAIFYPFPAQIPAEQVVGASLLILVISVAVIVMMKRQPYLFVGFLWYAITIAPVIGIIQISDYAMADHYHYLPSIGIVIMLTWGIPHLIKNVETRKKILFPAGIAILAILSVLTWQQCGYWKNSITLFSHALKVTKDNYLVFDNRGAAYASLGQYQQAIEDYNKAIRSKPDDSLAYNNRGAAYANLGQYQQAIENYNKAIILKPDYVEAYNNRGTAYANLGRYQQAIEDYNEANRLNSDDADLFYNRGTAYAKLGQYQRAIEDYNEAIILKPDNAGAYINRGLAYFIQGNSSLGCSDAQKACELGDCKLLENIKGKGYCR